MLFETHQNTFWLTGPESGIRLHSENTENGLLEVKECGDLRWLNFKNGAVETVMSLSEPTRLVLEYIRALTSFLLFNPKPDYLLNLGLGGGAILRFCNHYLPETKIISIEHSPQVVKLCEEYFFLSPADNKIIIEDAGNYIQKSHEQFDVILVDLFSSYGMATSLFHPAFHLSIKRRLTKNGIVLFNLIITDQTRLESVFNSIWTQFSDQAFCFNLEECDNIFVIAFNGEVDSAQLSTLYSRAVSLSSDFGINFRHFVDRIKCSNQVKQGKLIF